MIHALDEAGPAGASVCGMSAVQLLRAGDVAVLRSVHDERPTCPTCLAGSFEV